MVYALGLLSLHPLYFSLEVRGRREGAVQESSTLRRPGVEGLPPLVFFHFNCHHIISGFCEG